MCPAKVEKDKARGWIVPVGGAEDKQGSKTILRRFLEISGGASARIAVIPTASRLDDTGQRYVDLFKGLGAAAAFSLGYEQRADTDRRRLGRAVQAHQEIRQARQTDRPEQDERRADDDQRRDGEFNCRAHSLMSPRKRYLQSATVPTKPSRASSSAASK